MKIKRIDKTTIITTIICLIPIFISLALYNLLPESIPTHWSSDGMVDGYSSKNFFVFVLPLIIGFFNLICNLGYTTDPKKENISKSLIRFVRWIPAIITAIIFPISYAVVLGKTVDVTFITNIFLGITIIIIGNYLSKTKQSYTVGIKVPWTLNSEENWNRTHKMASYLWVGAGIIIGISSFIKPAFPVSIVIILFAAIVPMIYSYILYKRGI